MTLETKVREKATELLKLRDVLGELEIHLDNHDREDFEHCDICGEHGEYRRLKAQYATLATDWAHWWAIVVAQGES